MHSDTMKSAVAATLEAHAAVRRAAGVATKRSAVTHTLHDAPAALCLGLAQEGGAVTLAVYGVTVASCESRTDVDADGVSVHINVWLDNNPAERAAFVEDCPIAALRSALARLRPGLAKVLEDRSEAWVRNVCASELGVKETA